MTKKFIFRTAVGENIGIGHLMRCLHLADELENLGGQCLFILDHLPKHITSFLKGQNYMCLYDSVQSQIDQEKDADLFLKFTADANWIILDDYRLGLPWEEIVKEYNSDFKLCVIDDLLRPHIGDCIIDVGARNAKSQKDWISKLPKDCKKLLGSDYIILSKFYAEGIIKQIKNDPFSILISLGGGGDLHMCVGIIDTLLNAFEQKVTINVLLGPLSTGQSEFVNQYHDHEMVNCLIGVDEAYPILKETDLYIGAAGTMLLQARCLNIPAITFSVAENQSNSIFNFEKIGHYFHLNDWSDVNLPDLARFAKTVAENFQRFLDIGQKPIKTIDGLGSKRIAAYLFGNNTDAPPANSKETKSYNSFKFQTKLSGDFTIRPIIDQDINLYRHSRNLKKNHQFMILERKIQILSHYNWWFNNHRESFILEKNNKASLIIWHQRISFEGRDFMNAGWFVCDEEDADFKDVLIAMNWQVKYCKENHSGLPWLSVVKKDNKFAKQVNNFFGFQEMDNNHPYYHTCNRMFPFATEKDFHYIVFEAENKKNRHHKNRN